MLNDFIVIHSALFYLHRQNRGLNFSAENSVHFFDTSDLIFCQY